MISTTQLPERFRAIIDEQVSIYNKGRTIEEAASIPDTVDIPIEDPKKWLRIPDVICVFVDMQNSTKLSADSHDKTTAGAYQLFAGSAVKLFSGFEAPYIEVRGDGAFALFDKNQAYRAIAAAVTFKTFANEVCIPRIIEDTGVSIGCHIGIDQKVVLVRKLGLKRYRGRTDKQNEVWAGRPVNMAAKLASKSQNNQLLVSDRFFSNIQNDLVMWSCGCPDNAKKYLWSPVVLTSNEMFDFDRAYLLVSNWCTTHGSDYCDRILGLDEDQ